MQADPSIYRIPSSPIQAEQTIKKSRFICYLSHGTSAEQIQCEIKRIRAEHPRARHVCWAFVAGPPASSERGMSDDGEPKGTAGRPMLQILDHSGFGEIWVAVVRYFGGIKLGTGGLIRAYTSSVQQALEQVESITKQPLLQFQLVLDYNLLPLFENLCLRGGVEILQKKFTAQVQLVVSVPLVNVDEFRHDVIRISNGAVVPKTIRNR